VLIAISLFMTPALPPSKQAFITARLVQKASHIQIAEEANVSIACIKKYSSNLKRFGSVTPPLLRVLGRPPKIKQEVVEVSMLSLYSSRLINYNFSRPSRNFWRSSRIFIGERSLISSGTSMILMLMYVQLAGC
jgi:hypothetical protein